MTGGVLSGDIRAVTSSVQDEKRSVAVAEVIVVLTLCRGVEVGIRVVELKGIRGARERSLGIVALSDVVVDDLRTSQ